MKLLLDEMLSASIAEQLRARGHDVIAIAERTRVFGLRDPDLFAFAQTEGRAVVTYDLEDYLLLDRQYRARGRDHCGIVILTSQRFPQLSGKFGPLVKALAGVAASEPPYPSFIHWLR